MPTQLSLFDDLGGVEYDHDFIVQNPIPARCNQQRHWGCNKDTIEPIHAPSLENVRCFWCGGAMRPVDPVAYKERLATLWQHVAKDAS